MTFLNAILLAGGAAFLIPLLIHLLNKRRVQHVRWGAMHLLHEVIRQRKRRLRIEQLLLLLVRIAIPIVLAMCLARPVLSALRALPGFNKTSIVVLLDTSFSMRAPGESGTPAERSRQDIQRMLDNLPGGSDAQVVLGSSKPARLLDQSTASLNIIGPKLADLPFLSGPFAANDSTQVAQASLEKVQGASRELVVVSDFQQSDWKNIAAGASLPALEALTKQADPKPVITFYRTGSDLGENLCIASAELSALVVATGQPVGIRVRLQNHGKRPWQDVAVHLEADGARQRTARTSIPADGESSLSFTHTFEAQGDHALTVRIEGDTLVDDNAFHSVIEVRDQLNVLLVDSGTTGAPLSGALDFLELALAPHQSAAVSLKDLIRTSRAELRRFRSDDLRNKEVVILGNVSKLSNSQIKDLETFVNNGGGLVIFPGPDSDVTWTNRDLWRDGKGLFPCQIKGVNHIENAAFPARIRVQRYTHPATSYFNDPRSGVLHEAEIRHWLEFLPAGDDTRTILSLDRGTPIFVERGFGRGRVIAAAISANPEWTNLPLQPYFVPLVQRLITYLAVPSSTTAWQMVGTPIRLTLPKEQTGKIFEWTDAAGKITALTANEQGDFAVLESPPVLQPGVHLLTPQGAGAAKPRRVAFNLDSSESDLTPLPEADLSKLAQRFGAGVAHSFDEYQHLDRSRRHGSEVWQFFLLAVLLLLFFEVLLQQRIARG